MKLEEIISYPVVKYSLCVSLYSPRKSTALEWFILEIINKFSKDNKCNNRYLCDIFKEVLNIDDNKSLIGACLDTLSEAEAILINNTTNIESLKISDIVLTLKGSELQKDGLIPSEKKDVADTIFYNYNENKLHYFNDFFDEPKGIKIFDNTNLEVDFPKTEIMDYLKSKECPKQFNCKDSISEISDIEVLDSIVCWVTEKINMNIDHDFNISFENNNDVNGIIKCTKIRQ